MYLEVLYLSRHQLRKLQGELREVKTELQETADELETMKKEKVHQQTLKNRFFVAQGEVVVLFLLLVIAMVAVADTFKYQCRSSRFLVQLCCSGPFCGPQNSPFSAVGFFQNGL